MRERGRRGRGASDGQRRHEKAGLETVAEERDGREERGEERVGNEQ